MALSTSPSPLSKEKLFAVVERVVFYNEENGWSVLRVNPLSLSQKGRQLKKEDKLQSLSIAATAAASASSYHRNSIYKKKSPFVTVVTHQARAFAGASMEFHGDWIQHKKYGLQFKAEYAIERKPASCAALEKYLGSGLIKGIGPQIAKRIVGHFGEETLEVFESHIERLLNVPGIAVKKLKNIQNSWEHHKAVRDVIMFLQQYDVSTLFAVKIFKTYGSKAISIVSKNPYRLAEDIYGIGFFSADKIALKMGLSEESPERIGAAIFHVLSSSRDDGHCYLNELQITERVKALLEMPNEREHKHKHKHKYENELEHEHKHENELEHEHEHELEHEYEHEYEYEHEQMILNQLKAEVEQRKIMRRPHPDRFYIPSIYWDEELVGKRISQWCSKKIQVDTSKVKALLSKIDTLLSSEQEAALLGVLKNTFSVLTGGPGCGKTTSTRALVKVLKQLRKKLLLAAPTGRAAQRMSELIGEPAKTMHRLLKWDPYGGGFKKNQDSPLKADFIIVDECSMLDIHLTAAFFRAVPQDCQVLFIGDPDQLPSVGPGNVLRNLNDSTQVVPVLRLTRIFRQAAQSHIIRHAHQINQGQIPWVKSPLQHPTLWKENQVDCFFVDAEEATQEQIKFLKKVKLTLGDSALDEIRQKHTAEEQEFKSKTGVEAGTEAQAGTGIGAKAGIGVEAQTEAQAGTGVQARTGVQMQTPAKAKTSTSFFSIPEKFKHVDLERILQTTGRAEELKSILKKVHPWSSLHYGLTAVDMVLKLYTQSIYEKLGRECEIQVLTPQIRGSLGNAFLNQVLQDNVNPHRPGKKEIQMGEKIFRQGDRVIQTRNNYDLAVFNGDIGEIEDIDNGQENDSSKCQVHFKLQNRRVTYDREDLLDLSLAYSITIHKSQGSEFDAVIIPLSMQHFKMLFRNLLYTGWTRAKKLVVVVGTRQALALATQKEMSYQRQTALPQLIDPFMPS